jgi:hypothetical protein
MWNKHGTYSIRDTGFGYGRLDLGRDIDHINSGAGFYMK